jgi:multiple sugar transport system substrate-binding protein
VIVNRTHRPLPLLTTALAVAATAAACGGSGGGSPGATSTNALRPTVGSATVSVSDVNGAKASAACVAKVKNLRVSVVGTLNDATRSADAYMASAHPGIKVTLSSSAGSYTALTQQVSADKAAGQQTDVAIAELQQLPLWKNSLGAQPLSPTLLRASYDQRFVGLGKVGGTLYGIPQQVSVPVIIYNAGMLAKAGVDPASLTTTDGLLAAAAKIRTALPGVQPIDLPTNGNAQWYLDDLTSSKGAPTLSAAGQPAFDSPQALEAGAFLAKVGKLGPQTADPNAGLIRFGTKKTAIVGATIAAVAQVRKILTQEGTKGFTVGALPFPTLPGGTRRPVAGGNALVVLSKDACQREVATEYVVAMLSPDLVAKSTEAISYLPVDTAARTALAPFYTANPDLAALNTLIPSLSPPPQWPGARGAEVPDTASDAVVKIFTGASPTSTLNALQKQAQTLTR